MNIYIFYLEVTSDEETESVPAASLINFSLDQNSSVSPHSHKGQNANHCHYDD